MAEKWYPQVPGDSHLQQEVVVGEKGKWRLSHMGLLEMMSRSGKPRVCIDDGTKDGIWKAVAPEVLITNLFDVVQDPAFSAVAPSADKGIQDRLNAFGDFIRNVRAEWDGVSANIWQEPLLKLLKQLGYSWEETKAAILNSFPPGRTGQNPEIRNTFNRAASSVWNGNPNKIKIYSDV